MMWTSYTDDPRWFFTLQPWALEWYNTKHGLVLMRLQ